MAKQIFNINAFLNKSPEEQAKVIERETEKLINRLPSLKKKMQMYNDTTDEMYNLTPEEVKLEGDIYARAVRTGTITTPTGQKAYQNYIKNLMKYTRVNIGDIAKEVGGKRFESWWQTIKDYSSNEELEYVNYLVMQMSDDMKIAFTRSKYFYDNSNWNSKQTFIKEYDEGEISVQALELELFLQKYYPQVHTRNIYNTQIATDGQVDKIRKGGRSKKKKG